jgi:outer membrane receptor protein involved in Fe transport
MLKTFLTYAAPGAIILAAASTAQAQSTSGAAGSSAVSEIVVTAERRSQSVQTVDISMTVLSASDLVKQNVVTVNDLQNASPNLQVEPAFGSGQPEFRIRGVGFQDYGSNNSPTVGIYINDVAYPIPVMTQESFFDIARVEVLRGPQGTLYGRNTTGGAVNIITNQPTPDWHEGGEVEFGSYDQFHLEAYVSGPIAPHVDSRFAFATDQGGGFQYNRDTGQSFGDARRYGFRWITDWTPVAKLDVKLELHGFIDNSDGQGLYIFKSGTVSGVDGTINLTADKSPYATGWGLDPVFASYIGVPLNGSGQPVDTAPFKHNVQDGGALDIRYDLGFADVVNIVSYDFMNRREFEDWSSTDQELSDVFFHTRSTVISDELRFLSKETGPLTWIAGLYVSYQNENEAYLSDFLDIYGIALGVHYNQHVNSEAVFGQLNYKLTDHLKLIGGLRFEDEHRYLQGFNDNLLFGFGTVPLLPPSNATESMKPLTFKVGFEYTPTDDLMVYGNWSRGVKSGGFTAYNTGTQAGISPFLPEKLWATEFGYKWTILPRLRFNGSLFYYDYYDQQILSALYTPPTDGQPAVIIGHFVNAPHSRIEGGELDLEGEIAPHVTISQQVGYAIGHYISFPNHFDLAGYEETGVANVINSSGSTIPFPKLSYEGAVSYWFRIGPDWRLEAEDDYSFHAHYPSWLGSQFDIPAYWLDNLNLTLTPPDRRYTIGFFVHNLFDKEYDLTRNFFVTGLNIADPGRPRTFGGRFTVAF